MVLSQRRRHPGIATPTDVQRAGRYAHGATEGAVRIELYALLIVGVVFAAIFHGLGVGI